jgi:hypothetical protein
MTGDAEPSPAAPLPRSGQLRRTRQTVRRILGDRVDGAWDRRLARTADVVIASHPKVGTTWTRFMLACYVQHLEGSASLPLFDEADRLLRTQRHGDPGIRIYVTHAGLRYETQVAADLGPRTLAPFQHGRTILLIRHPLDTLISFWHQHTRASEDQTYDGPLESFVVDPVWGLDKLLRYYNLWIETTVQRPPLIVRYEDLRRDAETELARIVGFAGLRVDADALRGSVAQSTFEAMQSLELSGRAPVYAISGMSIFSKDPHEDEDARHVRSGRVGGWRAVLPADLGERLDRRVQAELHPAYGYG